MQLLETLAKSRLSARGRTASYQAMGQLHSVGAGELTAALDTIKSKPEMQADLLVRLLENVSLAPENGYEAESIGSFVWISVSFFEFINPVGPLMLSQESPWVTRLEQAVAVNRASKMFKAASMVPRLRVLARDIDFHIEDAGSAAEDAVIVSSVQVLAELVSQFPVADVNSAPADKLAQVQRMRAQYVREKSQRAGLAVTVPWRARNAQRVEAVLNRTRSSLLRGTYEEALASFAIEHLRDIAKNH